MISGAVVCPAAPLLIPGLADALAAEQDHLLHAVTEAVAELSARADRLLVIAPGATTVWQGACPDDPGPSPFGRAPGRAGWAPGLWVAAALAPTSTRYLQQVAADGRPGAGSVIPDLAQARALLADDAATGVIALADGARCHGDDAPGRIDPRSERFDAELHTALTHGPAALAGWLADQRSLGEELGSTAPAVLTALAALLTPGGTTAGFGTGASAEYFGAPYGVGYHLARWPA